MRKLLYSLLVGCVIALAPLMISKLPFESGSSHLLKSGSNVLLFPGYAIALVLALGRFHDINFTALEIANVVVYSGLTYLLLRCFAWLKARTRKQRPVTGSSSDVTNPSLR
jgi:phosphatidylserine synthase